MIANQTGNILVVTPPCGMGDIMTYAPSIAGIKRANPAARVVWNVAEEPIKNFTRSNMAVARMFADADAALSVDKNEWKQFDTVIEGHPRGIIPESIHPEGEAVSSWVLTGHGETRQEITARAFQTVAAKPTLKTNFTPVADVTHTLIAPFSTRRDAMASSGFWLSIAPHLPQPVAVLCAPHQRARAEECLKLPICAGTLAEAFYRVANCKLFVTVDSFPAHMGAMLGKPTYVINPMPDKPKPFENCRIKLPLPVAFGNMVFSWYGPHIKFNKALREVTGTAKS